MNESISNVALFLVPLYEFTTIYKKTDSSGHENAKTQGRELTFAG